MIESHKARAQKSGKARDLKSGTELRYTDGTVYVLSGPAGPRRGWFGYRKSDGARFRISNLYLSHCTVVEAQPVPASTADAAEAVTDRQLELTA